MKKLFMTRRSAIAYLTTMRAMPEEIAGLRVFDAESKMQTLDATDRLILDVRAGRKSQFRVSFPEEIDVFISDP